MSIEEIYEMILKLILYKKMKKIESKKNIYKNKFTNKIICPKIIHLN